MTGNEGFPPTPGGASGDEGAAFGANAGEGSGGAIPPTGGLGAAAAAAGGSLPPITLKKKRKVGRNAAIVGGVAALLIVVGAAASPLASASIDLEANQELGSTPLNAEAIEDLLFTVPDAKVGDITFKLNGDEVEAEQDGADVVFRPTDLAEGKHTVSASKDGRLPGRTATASKSFEIDTTAPEITFDLPSEPVALDEAFTLKGTVDGAESLEIDGEAVEIGSDGAFSRDYEAAPRGAIVVARDAAGNVTEQSAAIPIVNPGARSVHLTAFGWASSTLREPILQMVKDGLIDDVQLDIKDEDGIIGYDSQVPLAKAAGTGTDRYDAAEALKTIHDLGATVTGRIVAFRDPKLAGWAVREGKLDLVIQNTSGGAYDAGKYGRASFTNFANQEVIDYNVGLAEEAAELGFDSIMFDYIRKPENLGQVYPGIGERTPMEAIVDFVEEAAPRVRSKGAFVGAAVYGISSFTPISVAQDIPGMAEHLDYLSPMIYPSHWGPGEYSVASPNSQPYDIVKRSLMDFNRQVLGTDCAIIPWLQDFSLGVSYGTAEVRAQIKAARDVGINSFYLWNAASKYTSSALDKMGPGGALPGEIVYSMSKPGVNSEGTTDKEAAEEYIFAYWEAKENGETFVPPSEAAKAEESDSEESGSEGEADGDSDEEDSDSDSEEDSDADSDEADAEETDSESDEE